VLRRLHLLRQHDDRVVRNAGLLKFFLAPLIGRAVSNVSMSASRQQQDRHGPWAGTGLTILLADVKERRIIRSPRRRAFRIDGGMVEGRSPSRVLRLMTNSNVVGLQDPAGQRAWHP